MEQRTVVLVDEFLDARGAVVDDFGVGSGFNPGTEGFYGLGIDLVGLPSSRSGSHMEHRDLNLLRGETSVFDRTCRQHR